jgi:hypothetical protein
MEWRRPIDQQKPVAQPAAPPRRGKRDDFTQSAEYRAAGSDPRLLEFALRARAYTERLRRDIRH